MVADDKELHRLEDLRIITRVDHNEWATYIVVVQKPNGKVRICEDYKVTVNPQLRVDQHPIPRIDELFAKLQGGQHFSKLDISDAYLQVELDDATNKLLVVNTHKGLLRYNRLSFGPAPAPAIFQKLVDNLVSGILALVQYDPTRPITLTADASTYGIDAVISQCVRSKWHCGTDCFRLQNANIE